MPTGRGVNRNSHTKKIVSISNIFQDHSLTEVSSKTTVTRRTVPKITLKLLKINYLIKLSKFLFTENHYKKKFTDII